MAVDTIKDGVVVTLTYTMKVDGELVEEATADDALEYLHGYENIIPGLEKLLTGKQVGYTFDVVIDPEDGYGEYDEEDVDTVSKEDIPDADELEVGMVVVLEDQDDNFFEALIVDITDDGVVLDFNDPLAGKTLEYKGEVIAIRAANADELEQGFPEGYYDDELDFEHDHDH